MRRLINPDLKKDTEWWKGNLDEPIAPPWWFREVLRRDIPDYPEPLAIQITDAQHRGDWVSEQALIRSHFAPLVTPEEMDRVYKAWIERNPYHNFTWYCVGWADRDFTVSMSNPNKENPTSPFPKKGINSVTLSMVNGSGECGLSDAIKIGLFQIGLVSEDKMKDMVNKVQRAKKLTGITFRGILGFEGYIGWKPGGQFGLAFRKEQKI